MDFALSTGSSFLHLKPISLNNLNRNPSPKRPSLDFSFSIPLKSSSYRHRTVVRVSSNPTPTNLAPIIHKLQATTAAIVVAAVACLMIGKFQLLSARAEAPTTQTEGSEKTQEEEERPQDSELSKFLESNSEACESLKTLLRQKLEAGEDEESLKILRKLSSAQPQNKEWKLLMARLLSEMGETHEAREVFEDILSRDPLSFEALFENALLMDRCEEGVAVITRLDEALRLAKSENKVKEIRDVRLIMAQMKFLQKDVDEALRMYEELNREDPNDFRPYFCKGMIYSLLDRNKEAREQFAKYRELSPRQFEVEGYLRTPLSRMKLFGTDEEK